MMGNVSEGARRVWRHQRILWWIFAVNLVLSFFATVPLATRLARVADHSLHSDVLYHRFDVFAFSELAGNPEVSLWSKFSGSFLYSLVFFIFVLLLTGGVLESYWTNRKLGTGEFFAACGAYFWRWVRLLLWFLLVLIPLGLAAEGIAKWSAHLSSNAEPEKFGFWIDVVGLGLVLLIGLAARLWFDLAQVRAVAESEKSMRRNLAHSLRLLLRNFASLYWMYLRITVLGWLGLLLVVLVWTKLPATGIGPSCIVFEIGLLWWMANRLWQRASETAWYENWAATSFSPVIAATPITPAPPTMVPEAGEIV